ncbi:MAG: hypothetical protein WA821_20350 [Anaerolineales bacterium]
MTNPLAKRMTLLKVKNAAANVVTKLRADRGLLFFVFIIGVALICDNISGICNHVIIKNAAPAISKSVYDNLRDSSLSQGKK